MVQTQEIEGSEQNPTQADGSTRSAVHRSLTLGDHVQTIRERKLEAAKVRYQQLLEARDDQTAEELEAVAGILGFSTDRVLSDIRTITQAIAVVGRILTGEVAVAAFEEADKAVTEYEAETRRIVEERRLGMQQVEAALQSARQAYQQHRKNQDVLATLKSDNPDLLQHVMKLGMEAAGITQQEGSEQ